MRRTESPQALPHQVLVAPFVWDYEEDGPFPLDQEIYLLGEVPSGSLVFGGFLQISKDLVFPASTSFVLKLGSQSIFSSLFTTTLVKGWYALDVSAGNVDTNFLVLTDLASRMTVRTTTQVPTAGQFCVYLFYMNNELGMYGQIENPEVGEIEFVVLFEKKLWPVAIVAVPPSIPVLAPVAPPPIPKPPPTNTEWP